MPNIVTTNNFRELAITSGVNLSLDTFAVSLMDIYVQSATVTTLKEITNWSQVSAHEVTGTGYSRQTITIPTITEDNDIVRWNASNVNWNNVSVSTYGYTIYRISDGMVLGFVEFNTTPQVANNGSLTIQWNTSGILNIF